MDDLRSILSNHNSRIGKSNEDTKSFEDEVKIPTVSEIPDVFFDQILVNYKLSRVEVLVLMFLYRQVWCRPNLYKKYGIGPILSHTDIAKSYDVTIEVLHHSMRNLETYGFIETIRSGQYFVRKYFTEELDKAFGQTYDNFL
jgi:hypothetical protein